MRRAQAWSFHPAAEEQPAAAFDADLQAALDASVQSAAEEQRARVLEQIDYEEARINSLEGHHLPSEAKELAFIRANCERVFRAREQQALLLRHAFDIWRRDTSGDAG